MARHHTLSTVLIPLFALSFLASCSLLPSSGSVPTCGWTTSIPSHGDRLCTESYSLFRRLTLDEATGNDAAVHRLVTSPVVARRIIAYGRRLRSRGLRSLQPATTLLLTARGANQILASGDLKGQTKHGKIDLEEVIRIRFDSGRPRVVGDIPFEEW
ncbi:MAG TPA: hypothetical protein VFB34_00035 [Chloroflexota bacterium]|nr:hypothetical protein [Chloroflexota bacterium]